jgi:ABC-type dipeptide/oligopeptide/nickel transport system ATPase subunit
MTKPVFTVKDAALSLDGNAGRVDILHGIDLTVRKGESVGLVGPSGSGKSSLLMLLGGLERATSGTVTALGQELTAMDEDAKSAQAAPQFPPGEAGGESKAHSAASLRSAMRPSASRTTRSQRSASDRA